METPITWCFHRAKLVLYSPCKRERNLLKGCFIRDIIHQILQAVDMQACVASPKKLYLRNDQFQSL